MPHLKTLTRTAAHSLYKYSGAARVLEALATWSGRQHLAILVFHRVTDAIPEDGLTVSTACFEAVCRMLRRAFRVVSLGEVFAAARSGQPWPARTVAITFDDCYRDNLFAARVLARHGLPACFFVPTAYVGTERTFPWDRDLPPLPNLTWDDLRAMADLGFEIGSHTMTHPDMGQVTLEQARREIVGSKVAIERELGRRVRWFAYPFGGRDNFRAEWFPLLEEAGYEGCLSGHTGLIRPGVDPRVLPREAVPSFAGVLQLELHLAGCLDWVYALKGRLGLLEPYGGPAIPAPAQPPGARKSGWCRTLLFSRSR